MWLRVSKLLLVAAILTGCSVPRPTSVPFKVCADDEDPMITGCKKIGATAPITIRGHHED